jgi:hypothetical protein
MSVGEAAFDQKTGSQTFVGAGFKKFSFRCVQTVGPKLAIVFIVGPFEHMVTKTDVG